MWKVACHRRPFSIAPHGPTVRAFKAAAPAGLMLCQGAHCVNILILAFVLGWWSLANIKAQILRNDGLQLVDIIVASWDRQGCTVIYNDHIPIFPPVLPARSAVACNQPCPFANLAVLPLRCLQAARPLVPAIKQTRILGLHLQMPK
ncbi:unnamed protein product [Ostreobium quekettii]|uniref:Uncharacterized protein n=1 Tax=Ostreobium quekettii TaxID=121088 RepID=A0A8S1IT83_9CHLO|nr:unnamed protein product [Ostreobium quekettii]|eukprot:evm.model.scf_107.8 EVM.evm.TU.scf_107.8   scf_107:64440-64880(+)